MQAEDLGRRKARANEPYKKGNAECHALFGHTKRILVQGRVSIFEWHVL
jgi:hypothetical protein